MRADLEKIVWAAPCDPKRRSWKFVLLNLCHHANATAEAFPSVAKIIEETGYSNKAVSDALTGLEALGLISRTGSCGARNRVTVYSLAELSTHVDNLANNEVRSRLKKFNGELTSKKEAVNGELTSPNGELSSHRSILGRKSVGKLVCTAANGELTSRYVDNSGKAGQNHSAEGSPFTRQNKVTEIGYDAGGYLRLCGEYGFKPNDRDLIPNKAAMKEARRAVVACAMREGASLDQAKRFLRWNAGKKWKGIDNAVSVKDLAKLWVDQWKAKSFEEWAEEQHRRREAARLREEQEAVRLVREENEGARQKAGISSVGASGEKRG